MAKLFKLRGTLSTWTRVILEVSGIAFILLVWWSITRGDNPLFQKGIMPSPGAVVHAFPELFYENSLVKNIFRSIGLNLAGYIEAIFIALPIGFLIGLFPFFRGTLRRQVDALRYVPLTAVTGLFILWYGLGTDMKVHFLAFGILIYLLPVIVQRIDEVKAVYLKTVYTIGATNWQTIKSVYIPSVLSRLSDDIRVLTAISWTYIIIAESLGSEGGIGALIWRAGQRQGRVDKTFALLIVIITIGFLQDKIFTYLDKEFFGFKYQNKNKYGKVKKESAVKVMMKFGLQSLLWILPILYVFFALNELGQWLVVQEAGSSLFPDGNPPILSYLFGKTTWAIHVIMLLMLSYKLKKQFIK